MIRMIKILKKHTTRLDFPITIEAIIKLTICLTA